MMEIGPFNIRPLRLLYTALVAAGAVYMLGWDVILFLLLIQFDIEMED